MNRRLNGILEFLDLLAEGQRRQAESIAGRNFRLDLQPVVESARVLKFPLTGHQKARLFEDAPKAKVTTVN